MSFYFGNTSLRVILGDLFVMPCWSQVCAGLLLKICKGNPNLPRLQIQKPELNNNSVCFFWCQRDPPRHDHVLQHREVHVLADGVSSQRPLDREIALDRLRQVCWPPRTRGGTLMKYSIAGMNMDEYGWIWMKKATRTSHQLASNERIAQYCAAVGIPHATWKQHKLWMPMNHCRRQAATWPPWNRSSSSCCAAKMRCSERKGPPVGNMVIQWMMWMEWSFFFHRRRFRSQTSDNIWTHEKAEVGRVREEKRRRKKIKEKNESEDRRCRCAKR